MKRLVALLCLVSGVASAAPHLYADPYPATGVQPDSVMFTVNGGAPLACELLTVAGGKQPRCDLAGITAAGTYTLVLKACRAASIVNAPNSATVAQEACASSAPFALTLEVGGVATPTLRVAP